MLNHTVGTPNTSTTRILIIILLILAAYGYTRYRPACNIIHCYFNRAPTFSQRLLSRRALTTCVTIQTHVNTYI